MIDDVNPWQLLGTIFGWALVVIVIAVILTIIFVIVAAVVIEIRKRVKKQRELAAVTEIRPEDR